MSTEAFPSKSLTPSQRDWLAHLHAWRQQGGSIKAYAAAHELSLSALYTARRVLAQRGVWKRQPDQAPHTGAPKLSPVRLASIASAPPMFRVVLPTGVVVEVPEQADLARCRALLSYVAESFR